LEAEEPLGINYYIASAVELPFPGKTFDFATGFMSFMDIPEIDRVLAKAYRVLKPGGFLQFSIEGDRSQQTDQDVEFDLACCVI
jgi:ubiquinone/menaquinone biosynthesis C-methylase UbiE